MLSHGPETLCGYKQCYQFTDFIIVLIIIVVVVIAVVVVEINKKK